MLNSLQSLVKTYALFVNPLEAPVTTVDTAHVVRVWYLGMFTKKTPQSVIASAAN